MKNKILELNSIININTPTNIGLCGGVLGKILLHEFLNSKNNTSKRQFYSNIQKSLEFLENNMVPFGFENGISGFGFFSAFKRLKFPGAAVHFEERALQKGPRQLFIFIFLHAQ